jgi:phage portal protein BeeE
METGNAGGQAVNLFDKAVRTFSNGVRGMATGNPLSPSSIFKVPYGVRDHSEIVNARNAYMSVASIFGCISAYAKNAPQVTFEVQHLDGTPWPEHPAQWLIQHPNDDMSEQRFALYNSIYKPLGGSTQVYLLRSAINDKHIIGWRPYSTYEMAPVPQSQKEIGRESWISNFVYNPLVGTPRSVDWQDVVCLTWHSINPLIPQAYVSPIGAASDDINADKAITQLPAELLNSSAFVSYVFSMGTGTEKMPDKDFQKIRGDIEAGWTGKNKGKPMLVRSGGSAQAVHPDFRRMDLATLGARPEERICIALDVPIRYMGFSSGIDASTSDNYVASWLAFVKGPIMMQAKLDAGSLTEALTNIQRGIQWSGHPTIAYGCDPRATNEFKIVPNFDNVEALKSELVTKRANSLKNFEAGGLTFNEFRDDLGREKFSGQLAELGEQLYPMIFGQAGASEFASEVGGRAQNVMKNPEPIL